MEYVILSFRFYIVNIYLFLCSFAFCRDIWLPRIISKGFENLLVLCLRLFLCMVVIFMNVVTVGQLKFS